jgi:hypothetical protein
MKILTAFIVILFSTINISNCQSIGIRGGLNFSNFMGDFYFSDYPDKINPNAKLGLNFGPTIEMGISEKISFQSGIVFSQKGFKYQEIEERRRGGTVEIVEYNDVLKISYLQVPLNFKFYHEVNDFKIFGILGSYYGFALSGKMIYDDLDDSPYYYETTFGKEGDLKGSDFGFNLGFGIEIKSFEIMLTYERGIIDISQNKNQYFNHLLNLSMGYRIANLNLF